MIDIKFRVSIDTREALRQIKRLKRVIQIMTDPIVLEVRGSATFKLRNINWRGSETLARIEKDYDLQIHRRVPTTPASDIFPIGFNARFSVGSLPSVWEMVTSLRSAGLDSVTLESMELIDLRDEEEAEKKEAEEQLYNEAVEREKEKAKEARDKVMMRPFDPNSIL